MMKFFVSLAMIIYNIMLSKYTARIFGYTKNINKFILITSIANGFMAFVLFEFLLLWQVEALIIIVYIILYIIEFKFLCEQDFRVLLFGVLYFTLCLFSVRMITSSTVALIFEQQLYAVFENEFYNGLVWIISLLISIPHIVLVNKYTHTKYFDMLFSDKANLNFANGLFAVFVAYVFSLAILIGAKTTNVAFIYFYLLSGFIALIGYILTISYSYIFAKLKLHVVNFHAINDKLKSEQKEVEDIVLRSTEDAMSGFKIREIAEQTIEQHLLNKLSFFVIFIDMDGLKKVNDVHGHSEGDFYIKSVTDILGDVFEGDVISRIGGDEFLIVGDCDDAFMATKKSIQTFERVEDIKHVLKKSYDTSISYGIVNVSKNSQESVQSIIKQADERMYSFKKSRQRARV